MRTTAELREAFQRFYEERGHLRVPSHSLVPPADDPSTLFIVAGMQQFKPYFLGIREPPARRAVSVQKCLRAGGKDTDLEDVGRTDRHNSFFEMMGNFSFGDYFKDEAVDYAWEFVTKVLELDPDRLWVTVHEGNAALELDEDTVAIEAWKRVGIPPERIVRLGDDNFWKAADTGPCGPCSEIFFDRGEEHGCGDPACRPGHCDRHYEFYNLVFMQYDLQPGNKLVPLPAQNVDTGMGVERTACVLQGVSSNYDTDGFRLIMDWIEEHADVPYRDSEASTKAYRVLADHGRAVTFLIADGVVPSNEGRGYICRRLLRRAVQHGQRVGLDGLHRLPAVVIEQMGAAYPELTEHAEEIERVVRLEEERFRETLARGMREFDELAARDAITGDEAFTLATTYGFPIELTQELAEERGQPVDVDRFRLLMEEHRVISRAGGEKSDLQRAADFARDAGFRTEFVGYEKIDVLTELAAVEELGDGLFLAKLRESPFYPDGGGQVTDAGELVHEGSGAVAALRAAYRFGDDQALVFEGTGFAAGDRVRAVVTWDVRFPTMANHTATHLLHAALREVLGEHVKQAGSSVRPDKLRFDFSHPSPLSAEERERVERIVNEKVFEAIPVRTFVTPIDEARKLGAMMLFGEKYGAEVRVVEIDGFSRELCGGTHVRSTAEIGPFVIVSEGSVGSGARRIEAVSSGEAWAVLHGRSRELDDVRTELEQARREAKKPKAEARNVDVEPEVEVVNGTNVIVQAVEGIGSDALLDLSDRFKQRQSPAAVVLGSRENGTVHLVANFDQAVAQRVSAGDVVKEIAPIVGGGGGGRPTMARAGGKEPERLADALERARQLITSALG
ncbi:MAG: alanine--tRNA ligase [Actinobacteria bacterium]|nr:alanine--tRNA ligase [Actinomycetota bacterium]